MYIQLSKIIIYVITENWKMNFFAYTMNIIISIFSFVLASELLKIKYSTIKR